MNDRIKLAEAMGWTDCFVGSDDNCWGVEPPTGDRRRCQKLPDPFTDANDDFACLEWMRDKCGVEPDFAWAEDQDEWREFVYELHDAAHYQIGDYARALLTVME